LLKDELPIFGGANLIVVVYDLPEICPPMGPFPMWTLFYLKSENLNDNMEIKVMNSKIYISDPNFSVIGSHHETFEFNGKKYRLYAKQNGVMELLYSDTPLFNFLYSLVENELYSYLKKNSNNEFQL
jgi:hypothetical protein